MKGDFTRDTFDPVNHFSRVLMQQGRVQLDADWNEQASILLHYLRTLARDILGPAAGPAGGLGFEIITAGSLPAASVDARLAAIEPNATRRVALKTALNSGDIVIGPGRYYVEGVLVENERAILYSEQPGFPFNSQTELDDLRDWTAGSLFYLDVWERHVTCVEDDHIRDVALRGPDTCSRAQVVWQVKVMLEPPTVSTVAAPPGQLATFAGWSPLRSATTFMIDTRTGRLRELEPIILDTFLALNPDFLPLGSAQFGCDAVKSLLPLGTGRLRARARRDKPPTELCVIPPESAYRGLENQLYRVEVHRGGLAIDPKTAAPLKEGGATFKWSRENGSVTFPIRSLSTSASGASAVLEHLGRDLHLSLRRGDWVEVIDDVIAAGEQAGPLAQVDEVDSDELTVTLKWVDGAPALTTYAAANVATRHPLLRRWDHAGDPKDKDLGGALRIAEQPVTEAGLEDGWIELEDGVQIWFSLRGLYLAGDYWLIPARTATGDVDWAHEVGADGQPRADKDGNPIGVARPAHGPRHYFAPLLATRPFEGRRLEKDCRCRIDHLPCAPYGYYGDGRAIGGNLLTPDVHA